MPVLSAALKSGKGDAGKLSTLTLIPYCGNIFMPIFYLKGTIVHKGIEYIPGIHLSF